LVVRILIVGGLERHEAELTRRAARAGHTMEFHRGHPSGTKTGDLDAIVGRADVVIIAIAVNSHHAVIAAREAAKKQGKPIVFLRNSSPSKAETVFARLRGDEVRAAGREQRTR